MSVVYGYRIQNKNKEYNKLALVGINASQSEESYWKSIWPNTPLPKALSDLLLPESGTNVPIRGEESKQYWTFFFEHDLYPGNKINLGICEWRNEKNNSDDNTKEKTRQSFGARIWPKQSSDAFKSGDEKERQPLTTRMWNEKERQPLITRMWGEKKRQPLTTSMWGEKERQPLTTRMWGEKERQPLTTSMWNEKEKQPLTTRMWGEKERQPITTHMWDEKERQGLDNYCRSPSAIGEDKYCALSLESMVDFAISKLGTNIKVISSSFAKNKDQYVVDEVKKIGDKVVMCHRLNFKNVVFYCHQVNATTTYMVPLVALDGTKAKALTVCHHDTRGHNTDIMSNLDISTLKQGQYCKYTTPIFFFSFFFSACALSNLLPSSSLPPSSPTVVLATFLPNRHPHNHHGHQQRPPPTPSSSSLLFAFPPSLYYPIDVLTSVLTISIIVNIDHHRPRTHQPVQI
ncbi:embryonic abundant protein, putative [Medicago truncatula]|uniref:Embryonic abundant protein, putative n=1 Tax=Medicago truncatula TaxID=3880 RepID=A0A072U0B9_MEDTR|nr:embryonic abundant protein, putative [Medicago truncatula]